MSQQKQSQGENKPQQEQKTQPAPSQTAQEFLTRRVFIGDSADKLNKRDKQ
ncbi:TPA: hypothetical protein OMU28_004054 [Klebsiella aerogenes]|nr:hypothetical protein [Klebsiella aerogenes]